MRAMCLSIALLVSVAVCADARADTITLSGTNRTATLGPHAESGYGATYGLGNTTSSDLEAYFGGTGTWTRLGDANSTNGLSNGPLSMTFTGNGWDDNSVEGTWTIASSFWDNWGEAVISMHVGNGGGDPDHFAWLITPVETSGTFSYERLSGGGGGFSNVQLWGRTAVPEPTTIALLGLGLSGLAVVRRRRRSA